MRRIVTFATAWLAAAVVAVAVSWQGVGIVTRQVTDDRPSPLSAGEVRLGANDSARVPVSTTTTTTTPPAPSTTAPPPTTTAPVTAPSPTTTTTAPAPATTTTTAPPAQAAAPSETRTYNLVGGSASLRFEPEGVTVLWANPNAGFEASIEPEDVNGVQVEFESETHRSRVDGWWDGGPQDRVREEPR